MCVVCHARYPKHRLAVLAKKSRPCGAPRVVLQCPPQGEAFGPREVAAGAAVSWSVSRHSHAVCPLPAGNVRRRGRRTTPHGCPARRLRLPTQVGPTRPAIATSTASRHRRQSACAAPVRLGLAAHAGHGRRRWRRHARRRACARRRLGSPRRVTFGQFGEAQNLQALAEGGRCRSPPFP